MIYNWYIYDPSYKIWNRRYYFNLYGERSSLSDTFVITVIKKKTYIFNLYGKYQRDQLYIVDIVVVCEEKLHIRAL